MPSQEIKSQDAFTCATYSDVVSTQRSNQQHQQGLDPATDVFQINSRVRHMLSSVSTADLQYHKPSRKWIQRPLSKKKVEHMPITLSIAWDGYADLKTKLPTEKIRNKTLNLNTEGVADTGCSVLCGGIEIMMKLRLPRSALIKSQVTLQTADKTPLQVIPGGHHSKE